jgi:hypothetical protein
MSTDQTRDRAESLGCAATMTPEQFPALNSSSAVLINDRTTSALRRLSLLCLVGLCTARDWR